MKRIASTVLRLSVHSKGGVISRKSPPFENDTHDTVDEKGEGEKTKRKKRKEKTIQSTTYAEQKY